MAGAQKLHGLQGPFPPKSFWDSVTQFSVNSSAGLKGSEKAQNKHEKQKQPYNGQEDKLISKSH